MNLQNLDPRQRPMTIAIVAPSPVPYTVGGAEKLWWGMLNGINQTTKHQVELIKLPSVEGDFWQLMASYKAFSELNLDHFDLVISTKYPAWMVSHPNHHVYLQHKLRGLYDTYHFSAQPLDLAASDPELEPLLALMQQAAKGRQLLAAFWVELERVKQLRLPQQLFSFPGPLTRKIVHFLDDIALAPGVIRRYSAISHNVAGREGYFPADVPVQVIHHPSDVTPHSTPLSGDRYDYVFTISRLDGPKRIQLLLEAFLRTDTAVEFRIAGTGPQEQALKQLAGDDPRVRFLGRITDSEVVAQYADALFIPFIPYDEDYGLITIEAMAAGKAVLTTQDAGGVNEFVESGVNGLSVAPTVDALSQAMQQLLDDPQATRQMGQNGRSTVAHISWQNTLDQLLQPPEVSAPAASPAARRKRLVVAVGFAVWPPQGGGQSRVFHLYREVSRYLDVTLVTLCGPESTAGEWLLAPGLREQRIAKSVEQLQLESDLERTLQASVSDISMIEGYRHSPEYCQQLKRACKDADIVIASHPYLYKAIRDVYRGELWYEAHNVESDMKQAVLADSPNPEHWLQQVYQVEADCCRDSTVILSCSEQDSSRLAELYQVPLARCRVIANGVAIDLSCYHDGALRQRVRRRLGSQARFQVLFMGSWHGPNIESVAHIKRIAITSPHIDFLLVGSVCNHPICQTLPANVYALGLISEHEKQVLLGSVDIAINPMLSGSGTNLKMLDYAAAGAPILTTPFGNRGLDFKAGIEVLEAEVEDFSDVLNRIASDNQDLSAFAERAYRKTRERFSWESIALSLVKLSQGAIV